MSGVRLLVGQYACLPEVAVALEVHGGLDGGWEEARLGLVGRLRVMSWSAARRAWAVRLWHSMSSEGLELFVWRMGWQRTARLYAC